MPQCNMCSCKKGRANNLLQSIKCRVIEQARLFALPRARLKSHFCYSQHCAKCILCGASEAERAKRELMHRESAKMDSCDLIRDYAIEPFFTPPTDVETTFFYSHQLDQCMNNIS